jgi:hypothetical protein
MSDAYKKWIAEQLPPLRVKKERVYTTHKPKPPTDIIEAISYVQTQRKPVKVTLQEIDQPHADHLLKDAEIKYTKKNNRYTLEVPEINELTDTDDFEDEIFEDFNDEIETIKCNCCKEVKTLDKFYKSNMSKCKICLREVNKKRMAKYRKITNPNAKNYNPDTTSQRRCSQCKTYKNFDCFNKDSTRNKGLGYTCKECMKEYMRKYKNS